MNPLEMRSPAPSSKLTCHSRSSIYNDLADGRLPKPVKLGGKLYWPDAAVDAYLRAKLQEAA